jgi:dTDP-glucose 4,6-dehydratase
MAPVRILVTGACGFAGAHIVEEILSHEDTEVISLDCLTYAGRLDRLAHLDRSRIQTVYHDFSQPLSDALLKTLGQVDYIIHNGAESHVMRSFMNPRIFATSNIMGTLNILEAARKLQPTKLIYVSTDEVFGPAGGKPFKETDTLQPTNPYAATKASGEFLAYSYFRSFGLPIFITRTMNMFGERQHPEKCVPLMVKKILADETVQIHGDCGGIDGHVWTSGSRHWLHARTQANALYFLLDKGIPGQKYHISGTERSNLWIAEFIAGTLDQTLLWDWSEPLGPVHDFAYSIDDSKLRAMGWKPPADFETSLRQTVLWTRDNRKWLSE